MFFAMKKYMCFLISFFLFFAYAQSYIPFPEANAQWNCLYIQGWFNGVDHGYDKDQMTYLTDGDTVIGGIHLCKTD